MQKKINENISILIKTRSNFNFNDVERILGRFSGEDDDVNHWIYEFEDASEILKSNDLQCFFYAKQLLTKTANKIVSQNQEFVIGII